MIFSGESQNEGQVPGVSPLLLRGDTYGFSLNPLPSKEGVRRGNLGAPSGGIRLSALPAPRRATHRGCLGLLRRGRPFQQIPWERHPQGIILPMGCVVSAPLPSLSGPPLARGRLPDGGGTFLRKGHLRFPFPNLSLLEFRAAGIRFPWPPSGS